MGVDARVCGVLCLICSFNRYIDELKYHVIGLKVISQLSVKYDSK